jgi:mRNA-degrading endonuclease YafQ of YafQ-DinJ toxin-antitoxin module
MPEFQTLTFTTEFLDSLFALSSSDQRRIGRALRMLDADELHPSLQVHQLKGQQAGLWAAYASKGLRITFQRLDGGRKRLRAASHHYGD